MVWMWCDYKRLQRCSLSSGHNSPLASAGGCWMEKYSLSFWIGKSMAEQSHWAQRWHPTCSRINVIINPELSSSRSPLTLCKQQTGAAASGYTWSCLHLLFVSGLLESVKQCILDLLQGEPMKSWQSTSFYIQFGADRYELAGIYSQTLNYHVIIYMSMHKSL